MKLYLPFPRNTVTQVYAQNANPLYKGQGLKGHTGWDFGVSCGNPILSTAKAYCYSVGNKDNANMARYRAVYTLVEEGNLAWEVSYGHMDEITAEIGKTYEVGEKLGTSGNTGDVYSNGVKVTKYRPGCPGGHLHYQVRACKKVKSRSSKKSYLTCATGIFKKDGYYYEIIDFDSGFNGCVNPAPFFVETLAKDYNKPTPPFVFQPGATGYPIKVFQSILQDTGFFPKTQKVTEYWGPITTQSYEKFKTATGFLIVPSSSSTGGETVLGLSGMEQETPPWYGFVFATRFWAMVIGALAIYLEAKGLIGDPEMLLIATLTAGFIGVKTIDRTVDSVSDAKVEAAALSQEG